MALRDRLQALERRATSGGLMVIFVEGGLPESELRTAEAGADHWTQEPDESMSAFRARVVRLAEAVGVERVVIGGLP